jgi:hypothetical protein
MNNYLSGASVKLTSEFRTENTLTNPTTIKCKVKTPAGNVTTYVYGTDAILERDSTGLYHIVIHLNAVGEWFYRFEGTGACETVAERSLLVRVSAF